METLVKVLSDDLAKFGISIPSLEIKKVVMNTQDIEENSLFFAINSGNNYIEEALNKGASIVVCDKKPSIKNNNIIVVPDTVSFMQELARKYRKALNIKVIAITGSNGKTTTKDLVFSVLKERYSVRKTLGNYNNHIGVPYTILQFTEADEVAVIELGMSDLGEIDMLSQIAAPDYGIITNIGDSHLEFLKTRENVFKAKTEMTKYIATNHLIIYGDDSFLKNILGIKVGFENNNDIMISDYEDTDSGLFFSINHNSKFHVNLNGAHNCLNTAMAIEMGRLFDLTDEEISTGLENLTITPMRFEKIEKNNILYINDAYNASPVSMEYGIDTFSRLYNDGKHLKIAILGDMLELGPTEVSFHKYIIKKALELHIDIIYLYGTKMKEALSLVEDFHGKITHFDNKEQIKIRVKSLSDPRKPTVFLKGSRGMRLEEIIET